MLRRQRAIEIVPRSKPCRWRRYDVPQHLAPETSDALRFCAVEGDLDLLDRRHRSTIEAGSFVVSTGPPLARLWRMRPVAAVRRTACCHRWRFLRGARAGVKGVFDPLADDIFLAADAMHIDAL